MALKCFQTKNVLGISMDSPCMAHVDSEFHLRSLKESCRKKPEKCLHHVPVILEEDTDEFTVWAATVNINKESEDVQRRV